MLYSKIQEFDTFGLLTNNLTKILSGVRMSHFSELNN